MNKLPKKKICDNCGVEIEAGYNTPNGYYCITCWKSRQLFDLSRPQPKATENEGETVSVETG